MIYVKRPNLPIYSDNVLLGEAYSERLGAALTDIGLKPVFVPDNPFVDTCLKGHCDLSVFHAGDNKLFAASHLKNTEFHHRLKALGFDLYFPEVSLDRCYPKDCTFNICFLGEYLIYNSSTACKEIIDFLHNNKNCIDIVCRQGYTKCLVCPIDERSIITSDRSIAVSAAEMGMDVLEIRQGNIDLEGFDYGFIGGSCFKVSKDRLAFTGVLDQHPDRIRILDFIWKRGIEPIFLTNHKIFDVGSILPICEKPR